MTATAPTTQLTPAERRIAEHLMLRIPPAEIAVQAALSPHTVKSYTYALRIKSHCPPRCSQAVFLHALINAGHITAPVTTTPAPALTEQEHKLLRAITAHSRDFDIAVAARITPGDYRADVGNLLAKTGANDTAHLVVLSHSWGLFGADLDASTGADR